jgi:hypothetical protein
MGGGVLSDGEGGGGLDGVPVLLSEGVGPLLQALLALGQSLVLANRHVCGMSRSCRLVVVVWRRRDNRSFDVGKAALRVSVESPRQDASLEAHTEKPASAPSRRSSVHVIVDFTRVSLARLVSSRPCIQLSCYSRLNNLYAKAIFSGLPL